MLTDLPIGAWVISALLDAADVVAAVPTAAAGLHDWFDTAGPQTRVGPVHAAVNTTALSLYLASVVARAWGTEARRPGAGPDRAGSAAGRRYLGGAISDGCITCPWPGSTFRFADGSIGRSPTSTLQPTYHTRIQNGHIEVRAFT
jgi:hypothetical protein